MRVHFSGLHVISAKSVDESVFRRDLFEQIKPLSTDALVRPDDINLFVLTTGQYSQASHDKDEKIKAAIQAFRQQGHRVVHQYVYNNLGYGDKLDRNTEPSQVHYTDIRYAVGNIMSNALGALLDATAAIDAAWEEGYQAAKSPNTEA